MREGNRREEVGYPQQEREETRPSWQGLRFSSLLRLPCPRGSTHATQGQLLGTFLVVKYKQIFYLLRKWQRRRGRQKEGQE